MTIFYFKILTIILSVLFLSSIITIIFIIQKNKKSNKILIEQLAIFKARSDNSDYDNDIKFLTSAIGFKSKLYLDLILIPTSNLQRGKILSGADQEQAVYSITTEVYSLLSDSYKEKMYKYYTDSSLKEFISELVLEHITTSINTINNEKFKKMNMSNSIQRQNHNTKQQDITFSKQDI